MRCLGKCGLQAQVFMGSGEYEFQKMKNEVWEGSVVICRHVVLLKGDSSAIVVTTMGCVDPRLLHLPVLQKQSHDFNVFKIASTAASCT